MSQNSSLDRAETGANQGKTKTMLKNNLRVNNLYYQTNTMGRVSKCGSVGVVNSHS